MASNISPPPPLMDGREVARVLSCHPNTVANLVKRGYLRRVLVCRLVMYSIAELTEFIRRGGALPSANEGG